MRVFFSLIAVAGLAISGCGGLAEIDYTELLSRDAWQRPDKVIPSLGIEPGDQVVDLGAGGGYFVPHLVEAVGPEGKVYAVDVEKEIVERLERTVEERGYPNVEVVHGRYEDPLLPDGEIDLVLVVNTYHHIEDRPAYFARLQTDLEPGGRVAIIDPSGDLSGILGLFMIEGHTTSRDDLLTEMEAVGYAPAASFDFLPVQVFEIFALSGGN